MHPPTCTTLWDGTVLVTGGDSRGASPHTADIPLIFNHLAQVGQQYTELSGAEQHLPYYPFSFQLSDTTVFMGGSHYYFAEIDPNNPEESLPVPTQRLNMVFQQWVPTGSSPIKGGSAVMYRSDRVMKAGGGLEGSQGSSCGTVTTISSRAMTINLAQSNPSWTEIATMNYRRVHFYLIALPDGQVFAIGGTQETGANGCSDPVLAGEIYNPDNPSAGWQVSACMGEQRMYHSSAVLLPDARVVVAGGGHGEPQLTAQVFSPPYLFAPGGVPADRPVILSVTGPTAEDTIWYGKAFTISTNTGGPSDPGAPVDKVSLIRLGATTHSFDQDARFLFLSFKVSGSVLTVGAPAHAYLAPPGYYMVFILRAGVPSVARIVRLQTGLSTPPGPE